MKPNDEFRFGKYKGQTLEQVASIGAGKSWLEWLCNQPATDPKFANANKKRNAEIMAYLNGADGSDLPDKSEEVMQTVTVLAKLNAIENKLDILLLGGKADAVSTKSVEEKWDEEG